MHHHSCIENLYPSTTIATQTPPQNTPNLMAVQTPLSRPTIMGLDTLSTHL